MTSFVLIALLSQIPPVEHAPQTAYTMQYIDVAVGSGETAMAGQRYKVHYTGWLKSDGKKFDSSVDRNEPFLFVQGKRQVIAGWDTGFAGMKVGGKRRLLIPYQLAYGDKGSGGTIPGKADLVFDVELLGVETVQDTPAAADVLTPLADLEKKIVALANMLPEDKYDWRPTPAVRSFREVLLHVAYDNKLFADLAQKVPPQAELQARFDQQQKEEKAALPKEKVVSLLAESFATVREKIAPMRAGTLGADMEFFGQPTTRRGILVMMDTHMAEHLGQLIAYTRMAAMVPPWSK
jgi:uncharacterized damage-inducible protein DinB